MNLFPTQYSTLSSVALKDFIEEHYGLNNLTGKLLLRGVSDTYLLKGREEKYIFKVYRDAHRSFSEIQTEVELLEALKAAGSKVAYPVRDLAGDAMHAFQAAEGIRYGVLFSYAQGQSLRQFTDAQLQTIGREIAVIHNCTATLQLSAERKVYSVATTLEQPIPLLELAFEDHSEELAYWKATAAKAARKIESFNTAAFSYGYCHYDFMPKNFHFDENDQVTFFDFDFAGKGFLVNDLMTFWAHLMLDVIHNRTTAQEADRIFNVVLASYRQVRPLSAAEVAAIPYLYVGFWVFFLGFQYENFEAFTNVYFNNRYLKDVTSFISKIIDKYCVFD